MNTRNVLCCVAWRAHELRRRVRFWHTLMTAKPGARLHACCVCVSLAALRGRLPTLAHAALPRLSGVFKQTNLKVCLCVCRDTGYSYVIGFGAKYPQQPHHRDSACTLAEDAKGKCDRCVPLTAPLFACSTTVVFALARPPSSPTRSPALSPAAPCLCSRTRTAHRSCHTLPVHSSAPA
jgi:hypothetical protein